MPSSHFSLGTAVVINRAHIMTECWFLFKQARTIGLNIPFHNMDKYSNMPLFCRFHNQRHERSGYYPKYILFRLYRYIHKLHDLVWCVNHEKLLLHVLDTRPSFNNKYKMKYIASILLAFF